MIARLAPCALAAVAIACGARSSLDGEPGGEGGGVTTSSSSSSSSSSSAATGAASAGGGGGASLACDRLAWAGAPVEVGATAIGVARAPGLAPLDEARVALGFVASGTGEASLRHAVLAPWGAWPPAVTTSEDSLVILDPGTHPAITAHDDERFAFAVAVDLSNLLVGTATAGASFTIEAAVVRTEPRVRWLATLDDATRLVGHGPEHGLLVDLVDRTLGTATSLGALGCTTAPLASDALSTEQGVLVGSANGTAFDDCLDPDAPEEPRVVQTVLVRPGGVIEPAGQIDAGARVEEVRLAARTGGAWLAWQTDADDYAQIVPVEADGAIVAAGLSFGLTAGHRLAILGVGDGLGLVTAGSDRSGAGDLRVQVLDAAFGHVAATTEAPPGDVHPRGAPSVLTSPDGRSILVAIETEPPPGSTSAPIAILRADCAP